MNNFYNNNNHNQIENGNEIPDAQYHIEDAAPEKKQKDKNDFFKTMAKGAAYAAVFGLVAGATFTGFQYFSSTMQPMAENRQLDNGTSANNTPEDEQLSLEQNTSDHDESGMIQTGKAADSSDVSEITEQVMPSIVAIDCQVVQTASNIFGQQIEQEGSGSGTGIIIKQDKESLYIATNHHVVDGAKEISVTFNDKTTAKAEIKGTDAGSDLAVICVKLSDLKSDTKSSICTAVLGDSEQLKLGETAIAIGNALGFGQSVTVGHISAVNREVEMDHGTMTLIQTDAAINPGNSGGALVNSKGEVIGINSAKYASDEVEGMGFAIPISDAVPILEDLMNQEEIDEADQGYLGITEPRTVSSEYQSMYNMPAGVYIGGVEENSPAEKAGLKAGYIITSIKGRSVTSVEDIQQILSYTKGGTTVEVKYMTQTDSEYTEKTANVTLGKKSDSDSFTASNNTDTQQAQDNETQPQDGNMYGYGGYGNNYGFPFDYFR